jgi:hypothetical protein
VGLDLGHRDMNGPLLVQHVQVNGFRRGITTARAVNSQTFEHITLSGQSEFGFDNHGQSIAIRQLLSDAAVPAIRSYGHLAVVDAKLTGRAGARQLPAVVNYNGGRMYLRDVATTGYGRAVADVATPDYAAALRVTGTDKPGSAGPTIDEYCSHPATRPFGGPARSLRLPVRPTPEVPWDDPTSWAVRCLRSRSHGQNRFRRCHSESHRLGSDHGLSARLLHASPTRRGARERPAVAGLRSLDRLHRPVQTGSHRGGWPGEGRGDRAFQHD